MREQSRELRRAQRDVERTRGDLERQEKQLELEIKKAAKQGNKQVATTLAKQLVQLRKQKTRTFTASSQIGAIGAQAKSMEANQRLGTAMATSAKVMGKVNKEMSAASVMKNMQDFSREAQKMELKEEMIDETLDSVLGESGDEEEENAIVNQVLDEIGIQMSGKLAEAPSAPKGQLSTVATGERGQKVTDSEIEAQLARLKMSTSDLKD